MAEDERKYEILPGVKLPDYKTLKEASSDFDEAGVADVNIRSTGFITDSSGVPDRATLEEIKRLQELGDEVAEHEERVSEESKKKMQSILQTAVTKSASIEDLKKAAVQQASEEKLAEIEKRNQEEEARIAAEEEKKRMREERRAMQRKQLEDAKARASQNAEDVIEDAETEDSLTDVPDQAASAAEVGAAIGAEIVVPEVDVTAEEPSDEQGITEPVVIEPEIDIDSTGVISTDEETFEDFGEFLDDDNKK